MFFENSGKSGIPEPEPEFAGSVFSELISGNNFHYPNFKLPELPDPKKSGNPNAQTYTSCSAAPTSAGRAWIRPSFPTPLLAQRQLSLTPCSPPQEDQQSPDGRDWPASPCRGQPRCCRAQRRLPFTPARQALNAPGTASSSDCRAHQRSSPGTRPPPAHPSHGSRASIPNFLI